MYPPVYTLILSTQHLPGQQQGGYPSRFKHRGCLRARGWRDGNFFFVFWLFLDQQGGYHNQALFLETIKKTYKPFFSLSRKLFLKN
jgi:hypothetical protein